MVTPPAALQCGQQPADLSKKKAESKKIDELFLQSNRIDYFCRYKSLITIHENNRKAFA